MYNVRDVYNSCYGQIHRDNGTSGGGGKKVIRGGRTRAISPGQERYRSNYSGGYDDDDDYAAGVGQKAGEPGEVRGLASGRTYRDVIRNEGKRPSVTEVVGRRLFAKTVGRYVN